MNLWVYDIMRMVQVQNEASKQWAILQEEGTSPDKNKNHEHANRAANLSQGQWKKRVSERENDENKSQAVERWRTKGKIRQSFLPWFHEQIVYVLPRSHLWKPSVAMPVLVLKFIDTAITWLKFEFGSLVSWSQSSASISYLSQNSANKITQGAATVTGLTLLVQILCTFHCSLTNIAKVKKFKDYNNLVNK